MAGCWAAPARGGGGWAARTPRREEEQPSRRAAAEAGRWEGKAQPQKLEDGRGGPKVAGLGGSRQCSTGAEVAGAGGEN